MLAAAPSAVCSIAMACEALVAACSSATTSEEMRVEMARPAASSDALLMREPDAIFDSELDWSAELTFR